MFALHAGVAFDNVRLFHVSRSLIAQLTAALQGRTVIGQAQGIVMHRYGLSGEVAFEVDRPAALGNENVFDAEIVVGENERPCWAGSGDRRKPSMPRS
ncbi:ANTAR domain-containing protein [Kribbella jejuensis]|uniref:ANTAR domain-containing protein n=1 Tax=Kribbella jejuensis TaxID=236068 RepID=UPI0031DFD862